MADWASRPFVRPFSGFFSATPAAGGTNECAATVAGVGSVTGSLDVVTKLVASTTGVAAISGTLTAETVQEAAGDTDGVSTVSGALNLSNEPSVAISGVATVSGFLTNVLKLYGTTAGVASVTGSATVETPGEVLGQTDGTSTVSAWLNLSPVEVAGTSNGVTAITGDLSSFNYDNVVVAEVSTQVAVVNADTTVNANIAEVSAQVAVVNATPTATNTRISDLSIQVARKIYPFLASTEGIAEVTGSITNLRPTIDLEGSTAGTGSISGTLIMVGRSDGSASVTGTLHIIHDIYGQTDGVASVVSTTGQVKDRIPGSIPYPFPHLSPFTHEVQALVLAKAAVTGALDLLQPVAGSAAGTSSATGTLYNDQLPMEGSTDGVATVTGILDGDGYTVELSGNWDGTSTCRFVLAADSTNQARFLYLAQNVGVGFDPYDDASSNPDYSSQAYGDGDTADFDRFLYLPQNVGVGFNPTDDASWRADFVSQTFPDGNVNSFDRYLYLEETVFAPPEEERRLSIGPTPKLGASMLRAKPPVSKVGRGPEVA